MNFKGNVLLGDDEDPLYDKVPSDEDYASVASESSSTIQIPAAATTSNQSEFYQHDQPAHGFAPSKPSKLASSKKQQQQATSSPLNVTTPASTASPKNNSPSTATNSLSSSSSNKSSNKNTPSPKSQLYQQHKILNTRFEKVPPMAATAAAAALATSSLPSGALSSPAHNNQNSALVANAESCLNSIINSLNQIDYSHLGAASNHRNYCGLNDSNDFAQQQQDQ